MSESSATAIIRKAVGLVRREPATFAVLVLIAAAPGLLGVVFLDERDQRTSMLVSSLLNLYLQLFATYRALDLMGRMPAGYQRADATQGRYPSAFLASLLSTIAIGAGLLALLVPGLLLLALWGVWMPVLAAEERGVIDALRRSWRLARPHLGKLLLLVALMASAYALVVVAALLPMLFLGDAGMTMGDLVIEPLFALLVIGSPILWAAAYDALLAPDGPTVTA